jgi:hypothetical protein
VNTLACLVEKRKEREPKHNKWCLHVAPFFKRKRERKTGRKRGERK